MGLPIPCRSPIPGKIVCLGLNYLEHVKEGFQKDNIPKFPTIFMRCATSLVAHERPILRPPMTDSLDYEAELVLIIGKRAKNLTMENALFMHRRLVLLQRRLGARIPAPHHASGTWARISMPPAASAPGW